jgi:hypothetical protein
MSHGKWTIKAARTLLGQSSPGFPVIEMSNRVAACKIAFVIAFLLQWV